MRRRTVEKHANWDSAAPWTSERKVRKSRLNPQGEWTYSHRFLSRCDQFAFLFEKY